MTEQKRYKIQDAEIPFHNNVDFCVGTGRMGLALQQEYQDQLKFVQEKVGFRHIRGHGLFCEDMAIYHEYADAEGEQRAECNFTYLDMVMDNYRKLGLRPFLELGFMPEQMASGSQTVFYWKGNVTPPKDYDAWAFLVQTTLRHLITRYGSDEVVCWPIEVWNEPNLPGFWKDADMDAYFHLFEVTFRSIKEIDPRFQIGGPAICGVNDEVWMRSFLNFCRDRKLSPSFVTRHHYTSGPPEKEGHYSYVELDDPAESLWTLENTRAIVDGFEEFSGLPIHITEFNTSYTPDAPIHDTNLNAAYTAYLLSRMGECNESYSYWTFGDIFEEKGVPFSLFHGGFGLVADHCIPKPTLWSFSFFKQLDGKCVHKSENAVIVRKEDCTYRGVAWNYSLSGDRTELDLSFDLPVEHREEFCLLTKTVDEESCNPLKIWHDLGEPANPTARQVSILREGAEPYVVTTRLDVRGTWLQINLHLGRNAVVYFEVFTAPLRPDRGYSYLRAAQLEQK